MRRLLVAGMMLAAGAPLAAAETCATLDAKSVAALFDDWNFALSSLDANQVVQRYWPNAVLLPTVSNTPRTNAAMIGDYFEHFLAKRPRGRIDTRTIQGGCNLAMDVGTYTFSLMDDKGGISEVAARYTFIYQYRDGGWKIVHHHSSAMPESGAAAAPAEVHAAVEKPAAAASPVHAAPAAAPPASSPRPKATARPVAHSVPKKIERAKAEADEPVAKPVAVAKVVEPKHEEPKPEELKAFDASTLTARAMVVAPSQARSGEKSARIATAAAPAATPAASAVAESKTAMFANLTSSPPPSNFYPPEAGKRKERGNVNLRVCADDSGAVAGTPEVVKSSGSKLLDEAAQTWARAAKWVPATLNRRRVEGCTQVDVAFEPVA